MFDEEFIGKEGIMDGSWPVEGCRPRQELGRLSFGGGLVALQMGWVVLIFQRIGPAVVDGSSREAVQKGRQVAVYMIDVLHRERRQVYDERG